MLFIDYGMLLECVPFHVVPIGLGNKDTLHGAAPLALNIVTS